MEKRKNCWVIPTDKPSRFHTWINNKGLRATLYEQPQLEVPNTAKNIYITSDEEIKVGEWFITDNLLYKCFKVYAKEIEFLTPIDSVYCGANTFRSKEFCKKIIISTDKDFIANGVQAIDDEFLEWFCKNSSCEEVEVVNEIESYKSNRSEKWVYEYKIIIPSSEIWKDVPEFEGYYQVSNLGNVKSLERYVKGKLGNRLQKENVLSKRLVGVLGNQYYAVTLCNNKNRKQIKVSVLVAMVFLNHIPNGYVGFTVDHIDNNPLNNNVNNLQVITKRENSSKDRKGISKYTGVTFNKKTNKWRSQIWINGQNKTLGGFDDELEAHRAYQKELQQHLKSQ